MSDRDELLVLVDDYLAGSLAGERLATLERRLRTEPDSGRLFWVAVNHEIQLRQHPFSASATVPAAVVTTVEKKGSVASLPMAWWRRPRLALAACAALLLVAVGWVLLREVGGDHAVIAHIAALSAPGGEPGTLRHADQRTEPLRADQPVGADDRIEVAVGASLDLRFVNETTVIGLGSGTKLMMVARPGITRLMLEQGTLTAEVAHQAPGRHLSVITPDVRVEVVGTRFAVSVGDRRSHVEVEEGRIEVALTNQSSGGSIFIGPGGSVIAESGKPLTIDEVPDLRWDDHRPLGVMMLCKELSGWSHNPRGWFNDATIDISTPAGLAALHKRLDAVIDQSIANLREVGAQGLVFWDLEGLEFPLGYVGDPRQLGTLAPEMDAVADRLMARVRAAGFAVGMAIRIDATERSQLGAALELKPVSDPARLALAKIAYARQRWGATLFPLLGLGSATMSKATICRRVHEASPGILLIPTAVEGDADRWSAPWIQPDRLATQTAATRRAGGFSVIAPLEDAYLAEHRDELVRAVAAGDLLTVRAWYRTAGHQLVKDIHAAAKTP